MITKVISSARSYFTLGRPDDRRFATRFDLWVGLSIFLGLGALRAFALVPLADVPNMVRLSVGALSALPLFPFWFLLGRRFRSLGLPAGLALIELVLGILLPIYVVLLTVVVLGLAPSKVSDLNAPPVAVEDKRINPVFGFRPGRLLKFFGILFALFLLAVVISVVSG